MWIEEYELSSRRQVGVCFYRKTAGDVTAGLQLGGVTVVPQLGGDTVVHQLGADTVVQHRRASTGVRVLSAVADVPLQKQALAVT